MAARQVKVVIDTGSLVEMMRRVQVAADANPMGDDETPVEWMRRVINAACWTPDGWEAP